MQAFHPTHTIYGSYISPNGIHLAVYLSAMTSSRLQPVPFILLWSAAIGLLVFSFGRFFMLLWSTWLHNEEFSFGILVPVIAGYLIWARRGELSSSESSSWTAGWLIAAAGCGLQVLASRSGTLLLSGLALVMILIGATGILWGKKRLRITAGPTALLALMVPLPPYVVGEMTWHLQSAASSLSASILGVLGVPVYQDGNLLLLPNYMLEVKAACSGSRSIFALVALAFVLSLSVKSKVWIRVILVLAAPVLALTANVIRIVGTGLLAWGWGNLAANEALHTAWGIAVFLIAVLGLIGIHRLLRWVTCREA